MFFFLIISSNLRISVQCGKNVKKYFKTIEKKLKTTLLGETTIVIIKTVI